jgi:hypothetical protein
MKFRSSPHLAMTKFDWREMGVGKILRRISNLERQA